MARVKNYFHDELEAQRAAADGEVDPAAASKASPVRGSLSGAGRDVVPEQPLPPEWQAYLDKIDAQVRREQETAAAEDLWVPAAIMAIVAFVGGFAFYVGTAL